jgi:Large polyvalent protein associated domain 38
MIPYAELMRRLATMGTGGQANPFARRTDTFYSKPLPTITTTAKAPSWREIKRGDVDTARDAAGIVKRPSPQAIAEELRKNAQRAYAEGGTAKKAAYRAAVTADLFGAGAGSAVDISGVGKDVSSAVQQYAAVTGEELGGWATGTPVIAGALAGNVVAFMTGSRAVTAGLQGAGRAFGSARLANIGETIARARTGSSFAGRMAAELGPVVPLNVVQGLTDREGGTLLAGGARLFGADKAAKAIEARKGRVLGAIENQLFDVIGFGAMEGVSAAVRTKRITSTEIGSAMAGAGVGAVTDDENRGRGAAMGAILGAAGARGAKAGLSTEVVSDAVEAPFKAYSAALRAVNEAKQAKGDAGYWMGVLKKGARMAEITETKIDEWLKAQPGPITRLDIAKAVRERLPKLEGRAFDNKQGANDTQYEDYVIPGRAENYTEMLVTAPNTGKLPSVGDELPPIAGLDGDARLRVVGYDESTKRYTIKGEGDRTWTEHASQMQRRMNTAANDENPPYRSSHWSDPNPLVHTRFDERTVNGERALVVQDVQSDLHQAGRKQGYRNEEGLRNAELSWERYESARAEYEEIGRKKEALLRENGGQDPRWDELDARSKELATVLDAGTIEKSDLVPDVPFKKTPQWTELGLKQIIDEANKRGVARVVLPTGDQANKMFGLSTKVDRIEYNPATGDFSGWREGNLVHGMSDVTDGKLAELIGRERADAMLAREPNASGFHALEGAEIDEVGGAGMKAFYDQIVPTTVRDYAKKLGIKIDLEPVGAVPRSADIVAKEETLAAVEKAFRAAVDEMEAAKRAREQVGSIVDVAAANERIRAASRMVDLLTREYREADRAMGAYRGESQLADNLSFRMTPELKAAIKDGQPLFALGALSMAADDRDDRAKVGTFLAMAGGLASRRFLRGVDEKAFAKLAPEIQRALLQVDENTGLASPAYSAARAMRSTIREIGRNPKKLTAKADSYLALAAEIRKGIKAGALDAEQHQATLDLAERFALGMTLLADAVKRPSSPAIRGEADVGVVGAARRAAEQTLQDNPDVARIAASGTDRERADAVKAYFAPMLKRSLTEALESGDTEAKWYDQAIQNMGAIATLVMPELADQRLFALFNYATSILSNGNPVSAELSAGLVVMQQYLRTGVFSVYHVDEATKQISEALRVPRKLDAEMTGKGKQPWVARPLFAVGDDGDVLKAGPKYNSWEASLKKLNGLLAQHESLDDAIEELMGRGRTPKGAPTAGDSKDRLRATQLFGPKVGQYGTDKTMWLRAQLDNPFPEGVIENATNDLWMARGYNAALGRVRMDGGKLDDSVDGPMHRVLNIVQRELGDEVGRDVLGRPLEARNVQALLWEGLKRNWAERGAGEKKGAFDTMETAIVNYLYAAPGSRSIDELTAIGEKAIGARRGAMAPGVAGALGGAGVGAVAGSFAGVAADGAIGTDVSTREGAIAGLLGGLVTGTAGGAAIFRRLPGLMAGRGRPRLTTQTPDVAQVAATIATGARRLQEPSSVLGTGIAQQARRLYAAVVDDTYALRELGRQINKDAPLTGLDAQLRQSSRSATWAHQRVKRELQPVLQMAKGRELDVMSLVKARRDLQLRQLGSAEKSDVPTDVLERAITQLSTDPKITRAADALQDYYARLLEWKLDEGIITPEAYSNIVSSEDFYTPFVREWGIEGVTGGAPRSGGGKGFSRGTGTRKMDRDQQARAMTTDPFEMAVMDTQQTATLVGKQRVFQMVSSMVEANGGEIPGVIRRVPKNAKPDPLGRRIDAVVAGEQFSYDILDADVYRALESFGPKLQAGALLRAFTAVKEFKRAAITTLPDFMVRNLIRDNAQVAVGNPVNWRGVGSGVAGGAAAGVASAAFDEEEMDFAKAAMRAAIGAGAGAGAGVLAPQLWRTMRGVSDIMAASDSPVTAFFGKQVGGNAQVWNDFLDDGAASIGHYARDLNDARRIVQTLRGDKAPATAFLNPRRWYDGLQAMGSTLENAPRLATYKSALKQAPGDRARAAAMAADISLDFSLKGGSPTMQLANSTNAFFNARVQGWDKFARMVKEPKTWVVGFAALTAPSIGNWLAIHEDPESRDSYYEHPSWVRNTFWLVPTGGGEFLYFPKPFELGTVFATIPERFLDWMYTKEMRGDVRPGESARSTARELASSVLAVEAPLTDVAKPLVEQALNYDMFRNRPIVSSETYSSAKVLPSAQVDDRTSKIARMLGEQYGWSPQRIDHAINAYMGGVGRIALRASDELLPGENMSPTAGRVPIVGDLVAGFTDRKGTTSDDEVTVRRRYDLVQRIENTLRPLDRVASDESVPPMRREAAARQITRILEQERETVGEQAEHINGLKMANDALSELRTEAREIQKRSDLSREERKAQLDGLAALRARIARAAVAGRYDEIESLISSLTAGTP